MTPETLKDKQFQLSLFGKLIQSVKSAADDVISVIKSHTYEVKVLNQPQRINYAPKLNELKKDLSRLPVLLEKISNKEYPTFDSLIEGLGKVEQSIKQLKFPESKETDIKSVVGGLSEVRRAIESIKIPEAKNTDVSGLLERLDALNNSVKSIRIPETKQEKVDFGQIVSAIDKLQLSIPKTEKAQKLDLLPVTSLLSELRDSIKELKQEKIEFPDSIEVSNFPVQRVPQPVTNININGLRGPVKSTAITVTTIATALPTTNLTNRRSVIVYNNSSAVVYLGGSTVTSAQGFPVPSGQYSPPIDLSDRVTLYGIVSTSTADVRVLEASMDAIGS